MGKDNAKHLPTTGRRRQVETMSAYGIPHDDIARAIGITAPTLRKYYREQLDLGRIKATVQVAGFLFNAAKNGNVSACIFWLKTRAGWSEYAPAPVPGKKAAALAAALEPDDLEFGRLIARRAAEHSH